MRDYVPVGWDNVPCFYLVLVPGMKQCVKCVIHPESCDFSRTDSPPLFDNACGPLKQAVQEKMCRKQSSTPTFTPTSALPLTAYCMHRSLRLHPSSSYLPTQTACYYSSVHTTTATIITTITNIIVLSISAPYLHPSPSPRRQSLLALRIGVYR